VSEVNMDFSMDLFFRQYWIDRRLSFKGPTEIVVSADFLNQIWVPDTFIGITIHIYIIYPFELYINHLNLKANDKNVYFHVATVQNKFIRIYPSGKILYSMRMTVTASW
jgi:hypothetical protein